MSEKKNVIYEYSDKSKNSHYEWPLSDSIGDDIVMHFEMENSSKMAPWQGHGLYIEMVKLCQLSSSGRYGVWLT